MKIRSLQESDFGQLRDIHARFYKDEFSFPDFIDNYLCSFAVVNHDGQIISASGIRTILESVAITDKRFSVRDRRKALLEILHASTYISSKNGFNQIHAFIQDESWLKHLEKYGFIPTKGFPLVLDLGEKHG